MTADTAHDPKRTTTYRVMLGVVILLGVLIVVALGALVAGAIMKVGGHAQTAHTLPTEQPLAQLPPGAHITSIETSGNRVVVGVHTHQGDEIDIFDTDTGRPIARIQPAPSEVPK